VRLPLLALAALLAGCPLTAQTPGECTENADCEGSQVCARDEQCYAADDVRSVTVTWTVNGEPAAEVSCMATPRLFLQFVRSSDDGQLDFTPVPCELGRFFVDKLPFEFGEVVLGVQGGARSVSARLGASGMATLDLRF